MTRNPFYNAILALGYIVGLVSVAFYNSHLLGGTQESILYPIGGLAVFVLSAAVMAYLFFYQPVLLFLDSKREEGVRLFVKTLGIFACGTAIILLVSFIVNR